MYNVPCLLKYVYVPYRPITVNCTCTMYSAICTMFTRSFCKLQTEDCTLYTTCMWRKGHTVHFPLNPVHCKMSEHTAMCTLYTVHCSVYSLHWYCTPYSVQCTLQKSEKGFAAMHGCLSLQLGISREKSVCIAL